jgi:phosphate transport system protein
MGDSVAESLRNAKKCLVVRDEDLAYATVLGDNPINRASRECDRLCHRFIARHLPGAGHLREMAATIRVNVALERIGDYAVTISREALQFSGSLPEHFVAEMDDLADEAIDILEQARQAFRDRNGELAKALIQVARRIEGRMDGFYSELFAEDDRMDAQTMLAIFVVYNMLKRVADQAKNICDQTVYSDSGVAKIHKRYRILFLDQPGSGRGYLAAAIGRKRHGESAEFHFAAPGDEQPAPPEMEAFMVQTALPAEGLVNERVEALVHDLADFDIIISLDGRVKDYIEAVPFHSSALNWSFPDNISRRDFEEQYRFLSQEISALIDLILGDEAA